MLHDKYVSIPRSGFCVFGPVHDSILRTRHIQFQSLGRDSVFSDDGGDNSPVCIQQFQSLGRDSVFSDIEGSTRVESFSVLFQSLGRDSVFSDRPDRSRERGHSPVSIPRSGFCVFGLY